MIVFVCLGWHGRSASIQRLKALFQGMDGDGDGLIGLSEFKNFMRGSTTLAEMSQGIFATLDNSGSGQISFQVFWTQKKTQFQGTGVPQDKGIFHKLYTL